MPCTELVLNNETGEKLLFFSHDPILATLESDFPLDTTAMWLKIYVKDVDNVALNFSDFAQSKAGFTYVTELHQNYRGVNEFIFDLSGVVRGYVKTTKPSTGTSFFGDGGTMVAFYYEYGRYDIDNVKQPEQAESNVMYVARGVSKNYFDYVVTDDYIFSDTELKKFLTYNTNIIQPFVPIEQQNPSKPLTRVQKDFLYFIVAASDCEPTTENAYYLYVAYTLKTGIIQEKFELVNLKSGIKYIHTGIAEVITYFSIPFDAEDISSYKISILKEDTADLSETRTYKLIEEDCEEVFTLLFENRLGGFETLICRGVGELGLDRAYIDYTKSFDYAFVKGDALTKIMDAAILDTKLLRTGWIRRHEFDWLQDLACSVNMYLLNQDMTVIPIKARQVNYNRKTDDDLYSITLDISHTNMQTSLTN